MRKDEVRIGQTVKLAISLGGRRGHRGIVIDKSPDPDDPYIKVSVANPFGVTFEVEIEARRVLPCEMQDAC